MPARIRILIFLCSFILLSSCGKISEKINPVDYTVHTFYYCWFGNPEIDGAYNNWNHPIIPHWIDSTWNNMGSYPGGQDIGANYFPQLGCYSSNNPEIITRHIKQIRKAGIGVVVMSWWGKDSFTDKSIRALLNVAHKYGLKITFHMEPIYKTAAQFEEHLEYISENYSSQPAFYKVSEKPFYYIYDSYKLNYRKWHSIMSPDGESSLRNTPLDAIFISLWILRLDGEFAVVSGFDGVYTYYEKMFMHAVDANPDFIGITSFNEWHEGTQIEPAIPKTIPSYTYEDYGADTDPLNYIKKTRELIRIY